MTLNFPSSPSNGQLYENYIYNSTAGAWQLVSIDNIYTGAAISTSPPASPEPGDMWWDSDDGKLYIYYNDGTSSQWVNAAGPSVAVQDTAPTGYEGQLWLDSTDGSMYTYYTDPGGGSSSWIGAVSRSGGILQVVQTVKSDVFTTSSTTRSDVTGFSASITPRSTSSKILVMVDMKTGSQTGSNGIFWYLMRDSSDIYRGDVSGALTRSTGFPASSDQYTLTSENAIYLDSPSTTSSVTYKVQISSNTAGQVAAVNRDKAGAYAVTASSITLIEVAG